MKFDMNLDLKGLSCIDNSLKLESQSSYCLKGPLASASATHKDSSRLNPADLGSLNIVKAESCKKVKTEAKDRRNDMVSPFDQGQQPKMLRVNKSARETPSKKVNSTNSKRKPRSKRKAGKKSYQAKPRNVALRYSSDNYISSSRRDIQQNNNPAKQRRKYLKGSPAVKASKGKSGSRRSRYEEKSYKKKIPKAQNSKKTSKKHKTRIPKPQTSTKKAMIELKRNLYYHSSENREVPVDQNPEESVPSTQNFTPKPSKLETKQSLQKTENSVRTSKRNHKNQGRQPQEAENMESMIPSPAEKMKRESDGSKASSRENIPKRQEEGKNNTNVSMTTSELSELDQNMQKRVQVNLTPKLGSSVHKHIYMLYNNKTGSLIENPGNPFTLNLTGVQEEISEIVVERQHKVSTLESENTFLQMPKNSEFALEASHKQHQRPQETTNKNSMLDKTKSTHKFNYQRGRNRSSFTISSLDSENASQAKVSAKKQVNDSEASNNTSQEAQIYEELIKRRKSNAQLKNTKNRDFVASFQKNKKQVLDETEDDKNGLLIDQSFNQPTTKIDPNTEISISVIKKIKESIVMNSSEDSSLAKLGGKQNSSTHISKEEHSDQDPQTALSKLKLEQPTRDAIPEIIHNNSLLNNSNNPAQLIAEENSIHQKQDPTQRHTDLDTQAMERYNKFNSFTTIINVGDSHVQSPSLCNSLPKNHKKPQASILENNSPTVVPHGVSMKSSFNLEEVIAKAINFKNQGPKFTNFYYISKLCKSLLYGSDIIIEQAKKENSFDYQYEQGTDYARIEELLLHQGSLSEGIDIKKDRFFNHFYHCLQSIAFISTVDQLPEDEFLEKKVYLPPKKDKTKKTLILDLDETLVHCSDDLSKPSDFQTPIKFTGGEVITFGVTIRPYAVEFLKLMSEFYEVVIFTASHACYANIILNYLDPNNDYITYRLFRDSCIETEEGIFIKDLRMFGNRDFSELMIVDNACYSYGFQVSNGIPIVPYFTGKDDYELLELSSLLTALVDKTQCIPQILHQNERCMRESLRHGDQVLAEQQSLAHNYYKTYLLKVLTETTKYHTNFLSQFSQRDSLTVKLNAYFRTDMYKIYLKALGEKAPPEIAAFMIDYIRRIER